MRVKPFVILIHILAWSAFFTIPFLFTNKLPPPQMKEPPQVSSILVEVVITNTALIGLFYLNLNWLMGSLFLKNKMVAYLLAILSFLTFYILLINFLPQWIHGKSTRMPRGLNFVPVFMFLLILVISSFIKITQQWIITERRNKNIENEKLITELSFLKSQINPHFLFNTLNNIYTLALTKSDFTAEAVMKLSRLMRYVVDDAKNDKVTLTKEIEYINHFIELQRIRLSEKALIELEVLGHSENLLIAPLLLMPFVENVFKHGISSHENCNVSISLLIGETGLHFKTLNTIFRDSNDDNFTAIGLKNTMRRLDLLYPGKYEINIETSNNLFAVDLKLTLT